MKQDKFRKREVSSIEFLRKTPLFGDLEEDLLQLVASQGRKKDFSRGEFLFLEGTEAGGFYVLVSGRVKVFKSSGEGKEQILHLINPGESFAEASLFSGGNYPAGAAALEDSSLIYFPRREFLSLLSRENRIALGMFVSLSKWLRKMTDLVAELSLKSVESRLAAYIMQLCRTSSVSVEDGSVVELEIEKRELALYIGTVSETLSRTFKRLRERGLISVEGRAVTIMDAEAFSRLIY